MIKYTSKEIKKFVSKPLFNEKNILSNDPNYLKISIVTPSYNQARFLERTILSVLNQNYHNLEYIIIDGGSTDGSVEIIKKYEKYLAYWVSEKDKGQADAINKGFQKSTGDILAWINSDDTYLSETFHNVMKSFKRNPEADLTFGNIYFINKYDKRIGELRLTKLNIDNFLYEGISIPQPATFWKKNIFKKVGKIQVKYQYCMDFDFFVRIAEIGKLMHVKEYLANFRIHENSKTSKCLEVWSPEHDDIIKSYLPKNIQNIYIFYKKNSCRLKRIFYHFLQGDVGYILSKCINRFRGISFFEELKK